MSIRPIKKKILLRKCTTGDKIESKEGTFWEVDGITIPEVVADCSVFAEILDVSADCRHFSKEHVGLFVKLPSTVDGIVWQPGDISTIDEKEGLMIATEKVFEKKNALFAVFGG